MNLRAQALAIVVTTFPFGSQAVAHAMLKPGGALEPRNSRSDLKTGPCGGVAVDENKRTTVAAGQSINLEWEETVNHPGYFRLILIAGDGTQLTSVQPIVVMDRYDDTQNGQVIAADSSTWHHFSTTVTVPDVSCEKCAFEFVQVMTDRNPPTNYHSCADVRITGGTTVISTSTTSEPSATETSTASSTATGAEDEDALATPAAPTGVQVDVWRGSPPAAPQ